MARLRRPQWLRASRRTLSGHDYPLHPPREVITLDLPGHGASPAEADSTTFAGLAQSLEAWLTSEGLTGADLVGSSLGARLVLEMAKRGRAGSLIALDPGGFWEGWEHHFIKSSLTASGVLLRSLRPALPSLGHNPVARSMLLAQLCARPWALNGDLVSRELQSFADTQTFDALVHDLAYGPTQQGPAHPASGSITVGWGRRDRLCFPDQAHRAQAAFPGSKIVWFARSGHFPMWEEPEATVQAIRNAVG